MDSRFARLVRVRQAEEVRGHGREADASIPPGPPRRGGAKISQKRSLKGIPQQDSGGKSTELMLFGGSPQNLSMERWKEMAQGPRPLPSSRAPVTFRIRSPATRSVAVKASLANNIAQHHGKKTPKKNPKNEIKQLKVKTNESAEPQVWLGKVSKSLSRHSPKSVPRPDLPEFKPSKLPPTWCRS